MRSSVALEPPASGPVPPLPSMQQPVTSADRPYICCVCNRAVPVGSLRDRPPAYVRVGAPHPSGQWLVCQPCDLLDTMTRLIRDVDPETTTEVHTVSTLVVLKEFVVARLEGAQ